MTTNHQIASKFRLGHDIRAVGKWSRLLVGVMGLIVSLAVIIQQGIVRDSILYLGAIFIAYFAAYQLLGKRILAKMNPWVGTILFVGPAVVISSIPSLPLALRMAMVAYFSFSMFFNVLFNYGGCEVLAIQSFLFRRWYTVYCPMNVIDLVENAVVGNDGEAKAPPE